MSLIAFLFFKRMKWKAERSVNIMDIVYSYARCIIMTRDLVLYELLQLVAMWK